MVNSRRADWFHFKTAISSGIGPSESARFLEQFRYTIVASQLLNDHTPLTLPKAGAGLSRVADPSHSSSNRPTAYSLQGVLVTAIIAFLVAWLVHGTKATGGSLLKSTSFWITSATLATVAIILYVFTKRRWLEHLRHQAIDAAANLISNARTFDEATLAALGLIQEVELVSRGYNLSVGGSDCFTDFC
jgi:hypothetical protein